MTRFLLDANVFIALLDSDHVHHDHAHEWFARMGRSAWATCPMTENAVLRIVGHARYPNSPGPPAAVAALMSEFLAHPGHEFWPDQLSLLDPQRIDASRLLHSVQVTDSYLLALAASHSGKLATFDRRIITDAAANGAQALHLIA